MSARLKSPRPTPWMNALFGAVLLLVAVLDMVLLGNIGLEAWRRSTVSDQWRRMREEERYAGPHAAGEAALLRAAVGAAQDRLATSQMSLPSDGEVAAYIADLRSEAALMGVTITEIIPQPTPTTTVPIRRFTIHAQGLWPQLLGFLSQVSQAPLSTAHLEEITVLRQEPLDACRFDLVVTVRPPEPLAQAGASQQLAPTLGQAGE